MQYDNKASVKEARQNGDLPSENQGLKGMEWVEYPIVKKSVKKGHGSNKGIIDTYVIDIDTIEWLKIGDKRFNVIDGQLVEDNRHEFAYEGINGYNLL